jgi:hypothetical protein
VFHNTFGKSLDNKNEDKWGEGAFLKLAGLTVAKTMIKAELLFVGDDPRRDNISRQVRIG